MNTATATTSFDNNNNTSNNNNNDNEARKKYENNNNNKRRTNHLPLSQFKQHNTATTTAANPKNPSSLTQKQDDSLPFITLSYDATASQGKKCAKCQTFIFNNCLLVKNAGHRMRIHTDNL